MVEVTMQLAKDFNVNCAYTQSDEISLAWNIENYESEMFCNGKILKLNSHLASRCSVKFNKLLPKYLPEKGNEEAAFDCRVLSIPNTIEATNMFVWREIDCTRNSIQMAGQAFFNHKQLHKKNSSAIQEMLFLEKGINWNDYPDFFKRGTYILRRKVVQEPDLSRIPVEHRDKVSKSPIEKSEFLKYDMPPIRKVSNRSRVLFYEENPVLTPT
jgi:tRNA(His) 5'-end guanylyltransferase